MPKILTWLRYQKNKLLRFKQSSDSGNQKGEQDSPYDIFKGLKRPVKEETGSSKWQDSRYENSGFIEHKKELLRWTKFEIFSISFEILIILYIVLFFLGIVPLF